MRSSALVRVAGSLAVGALAAVSFAVPAHAEPAPPVVVDDTIALYPGQSGTLDVLANDSAPSGDDLALCRFPGLDLTSPTMPPVFAIPTANLGGGGGGVGEVAVAVSPRARGTHVIDYYVCDTTHLTPAKLSVAIKPVAPVDVVKTAHRGVLRLTNQNDKAVRFFFGHPRASRPDGRVRVGAGETTTLRVQRHRIAWIALIGTGGGKSSLFASPGIADHGVVRHIPLRGAALPDPKSGRSDSISSTARARWAAPRTPAWVR